MLKLTFLVQQVTIHSISDSKSEDMDQDIDRDLLQDMRHFKLLLEKEHFDELKKYE